MYTVHTVITIGGRQFDFSFNEDTNLEQLDRALSQMEYLARTLPEEKPSPPAQPSQTDNQSFHCNRVIITGTLKEPRIEMYGSDPGLKFPILKCPYTIFERYYKEDDVTDFRTVGLEVEVNWTVTWVRSEKNPKYKNLQGIEVNQ